MPFQPAADERAERTNIEASRPRVIERISCDLRAHPLTLIPLGYLGVKKNDRVGCELVLRYTGERAVNPGLEARVCRIVDDRHTHVAHCARGARDRSGQASRNESLGPSGLVDSDRALRKPAALSSLLELGEQLTHRSSGALTSPARCDARQDVAYLAPRRPRQSHQPWRHRSFKRGLPMVVAGFIWPTSALACPLDAALGSLRVR